MAAFILISEALETNLDCNDGRARIGLLSDAKTPSGWSRVLLLVQLALMTRSVVGMV